MSKQDKHTDQLIEMGLRISYYRKLAGYNQEKLSEKVGISRSYLGSIEAPYIAKSISLSTLFDIAEALDVPPNKLIEFEGK